MNQKKLDETWKNCLAMWKWIAKRVHRPYECVEDLKERWLRKHNFPYLWANCFFCEVAHHKGNCITGCPGRKVDPDFNCYNPEYNYMAHPKLFYKKLVSLNRKRKRNRKK